MILLVKFHRLDDRLPALPDDDRICLEITHINRGSFVNDIRVLADQEPAHVWEEEASLRVVRVRIRVREFMVDSVVPYPFVKVILQNALSNNYNTFLQKFLRGAYFFMNNLFYIFENIFAILFIKGIDHTYEEIVITNVYSDECCFFLKWTNKFALARDLLGKLRSVKS